MVRLKFNSLYDTCIVLHGKKYSITLQFVHLTRIINLDPAIPRFLSLNWPGLNWIWAEPLRAVFNQSQARYNPELRLQDWSIDHSMQCIDGIPYQHIQIFASILKTGSEWERVHTINILSLLLILCLIQLIQIIMFNLILCTLCHWTLPSLPTIFLLPSLV